MLRETPVSRTADTSFFFFMNLVASSQLEVRTGRKVGKICRKLHNSSVYLGRSFCHLMQMGEYNLVP